MSKSKHATQQLQNANGGNAANREEELLKLTKAKAV